MKSHKKQGKASLSVFLLQGMFLKLYSWPGLEGDSSQGYGPGCLGLSLGSVLNCVIGKLLTSLLSILICKMG